MTDNNQPPSLFDLPAGAGKAAPAKLPPLSAEQAGAVEQVLSNKTVSSIITGPAGTGKSLIIKHLKTRGVSVCATTGKAALNVGGATVDAVFSYNRTKNETRSRSRLERNMAVTSNFILIDEASMVGLNMANYIADIAEEFDKRIILVGDWGQAMPVKDEWPVSSRLFADVPIVKLLECHRQADGPYLSALNRIRNGSISADDIELFRSRTNPTPPSRDFPGICVYATNKIVDDYNYNCIDDHCRTTGVVPVTFVTKFQDCRNDYMKNTYPLDQRRIDTLIEDCGFAHNEWLAVGCKVVITRNAPDSSFVNGDVGTIFEMRRDERVVVVDIVRDDVVTRVNVPELELDSDNVGEVQFRFIGFPLRLGYGVTVHKCQGMTVNQCWVDFASICHHPRGSRHGLAYVALSRTRTLDGLQISGWNSDALEVDEEILPWL
jgi:ATP-dependent exoDNAse (exonuclease V) alpha subunit